MANLKDTMAYIIANYPKQQRHELSNARLTKMVYLTDWRHVLSSGRQVTPIRWYFDSFGPFVRDVQEMAKANPELFAISEGTNMYGQPKRSFNITIDDPEVDMSASEKAAADHIISITKPLFWEDFIKLVYATHPVATSERYNFLDLIQSASAYRAEKR